MNQPNIEVTQADLDAVANIRRASGELDFFEGKLWARTPFSYKDHLKAIPGARWNPEMKQWFWSASSHAAFALQRSIPQHVAYRTPAFLAYLDEAQRADQERTAILNTDEESLAAVPITRHAAWGHQRRAYWSAQGKNAYLLAMDMGTGKSKVAIDLLQNSEDRMVLIGCPKSVVGVWPREFSKHAFNPDAWRVVALRTGSTERNLALAKQAAALAVAEKRRLVVVVNYEAAWRDSLGKWLKAQQWDTIIADESHRIKSPTGKASKFFGELTSRGRRRLALTGTPMAHTPLDIFAQYRFLDPTIFGASYFSFKHRYGAWGGYGGYQLVGIINEADLNKRFYSIAYRVGKEVLDLPPVLPDINREVTLSPEARKHYKAMADDFVTWVRESDEGAVVATNALTKLLRLQQITSGYLPDPEHEGESVRVDTSKADALADILEDLDEREPVVVFCQFRHDLDSIKEVAEKLGRRYGELSGRSQSGLNKDAEMRDDIDIIGVQIQAGGVGIDLTRARYCIYFSMGYSLGNFLQSQARVHRPGQTRPTQYIYLIVPGSVDVAVVKALTSRKDAISAVLDLAQAGDIDSVQADDFDSAEVASFSDEWTFGDAPEDQRANRRQAAEESLGGWDK